MTLEEQLDNTIAKIEKNDPDRAQFLRSQREDYLKLIQENVNFLQRRRNINLIVVILHMLCVFVTIFALIISHTWFAFFGVCITGVFFYKSVRILVADQRNLSKAMKS